MTVRYSNFGKSASTTKLYAIKANKQTIDTVNLDPISLGVIQKTAHEIIRIKTIGNNIFVR